MITSADTPVSLRDRWTTGRQPHKAAASHPGDRLGRPRLRSVATCMQAAKDPAATRRWGRWRARLPAYAAGALLGRDWRLATAVCEATRRRSYTPPSMGTWPRVCQGLRVLLGRQRWQENGPIAGDRKDNVRQSSTRDSFDAFLCIPFDSLT